MIACGRRRPHAKLLAGEQRGQGRGCCVGGRRRRATAIGPLRLLVRKLVELEVDSISHLGPGQAGCERGDRRTPQLRSASIRCELIATTNVTILQARRVSCIEIYVSLRPLAQAPFDESAIPWVPGVVEFPCPQSRLSRAHGPLPSVGSTAILWYALAEPPQQQEKL